MIDWGQLEELYAASKSDKPRVRETAQAAIDANIDKWLEEYLGLPEQRWGSDARPGTAFQHKHGQPRFADYGELARWVTCWLRHGPGEWEAYRKKAEELTADKLGILLRARKHERARQLHRDDWDYVTIYGDRYMLDLTPALAPGDVEPQRKEFVLPCTGNASAKDTKCCN